MLGYLYVVGNHLLVGVDSVYRMRSLAVCVSLRSKRSRSRRTNSARAKVFFAFGPRENWGEGKKVEGRGWGRGKKGTLSRKPLNFEKRPLALTVEFIY